MRLTRVFVDAALSAGGQVELPRETASHLVKVLRARGGEELVLFNGDGCEFAGTIEAVRGSRVTASIGAGRSIGRESPCELTLIQCVPRGDRMDFIVQKATELGVSRIVPVLSQRSVVRLDSAQADSKQVHWRAVAVSACEQSGRNRLPTIDPPQPLLNYLGALPLNAPSGEFLRLILEPDRAAPARSAATPATPARVLGAAVAVGPEGGFAPEEVEAFELSGFSRLALGPRVLRTETAAIAAMVILQLRFGDLSAVSED